jgi:hypothetical protein
VGENGTCQPSDDQGRQQSGPPVACPCPAHPPRSVRLGSAAGGGHVHAAVEGNLG